MSKKKTKDKCPTCGAPIEYIPQMCQCEIYETCARCKPVKKEPNLQDYPDS